MVQARTSRSGARGGHLNRLMGLDAARGAAMSLVCLAHFQNAYLYPLGIQGTDEGLDRLTRAATPAFILISGFILGFMYFANQAAFDAVRRKLVDRALFLLSFAHLAIVAAHVPIVGLWGALDIVFVTDTIGVCLLVGSVVVPTLGVSARADLGVLLYAAATLVVFLWLPREGSSAQVVKHLLIGHREDLERSAFTYNFPILQWLAVYLVATALGERLARFRSQAGRAGFGALNGLAAASVVTGALVWRLREHLELLPAFTGASRVATAVFLTSPLQKLPPGPVYLLFYLGLALFLMTACLWLERVRPGAVALRILALLGRNSLFVFVVQYFLYYSLLYSLHLHYTRLWPLLFAVSFLLLIPATLVWQRAGGQRFLTVGYPGWIGRVARLKAARQGERALANRGR